MNKIILHPDTEDIISQTIKTRKRGAKVFGLPVSKELASYIEDVAPNATETRILSMFFAGKFHSVSTDDDEFFGDDE